MKPLTASKEQIKLLHILKSKLGIDDETYRTALFKCGAESSIQLTRAAADKLVQLWTSQATQMGVWNKTGVKRKLKFDGLDGRKGDFAKPAQLRKIDVKWAQVSRLATNSERSAALNIFLHRRFGISNIEFVKIHQVGKIIKTLDAMLEQANV